MICFVLEAVYICVNNVFSAESSAAFFALVILAHKDVVFLSFFFNHLSVLWELCIYFFVFIFSHHLCLSLNYLLSSFYPHLDAYTV